MLIDHQKLDVRAEEHPVLGQYRLAVRKEIPAVIAISAAVNILLLTSSVYMLQVLDRVLASGSTETLIYLTVIALVALGVYGGLEYNRRQILSRVGAFTDQRLTPAIFSQMIQRGALGDRRFNTALTGATSIRSFLSGDNALAFCGRAMDADLSNCDCADPSSPWPDCPCGSYHIVRHHAFA